MKKFNILDVIIVLVVIVCVIGVGFRFAVSPDFGKSSAETFDYVIKISGIRMYSVDALKKSVDLKSTLMDNDAKSVCGEVYKVDFETKKEAMQLSDGTVKWVDVIDRYDAYLYVRTTGKISPNGYIAESGEEVLMGQYTNFSTPWSGFNGLVVDVGQNLENNDYKILIK